MKKIFLTKVLVITCAFTLSFEAHSQSSFSFQYSTLLDDVPNDVIETPDGGYIVSAVTGTYSPRYYSTLLIKLNSFGDTVQTKTISKSSGSCIIGDLVEAGDGNFFGIGRQVFPGEERIWLVKMNADMDLLMDTTYSINAFYILLYKGYIDQYEDLLIYGSASVNNFDNHPYVYKLTQAGDSISYVYYNDSTGAEELYSVIEKPDLSGYYMLIRGDYYVLWPTSGTILTLNYNLDVMEIDSLPGGYVPYYDAKVLNNHQFIFTAKKTTSNPPRTDKIGIQKLDTTFVSLACTFLGPEDTITYPGTNRSIDFLDTNRLLLGGTCNQDFQTLFSSKKSYYILGEFDPSLSLQWQKYYGGDQYYTLTGIMATSDGGCLLFGKTFNNQTQYNEHDIYIIKVDSNGVVTSSGTAPLPLSHDAIVYPNPGKDYIIIESGPQIKGASLVLYDLRGFPVKTETLDYSFQKIYTTDLITGIFIWQINFEGKPVESGKWIKN